VTVLDSVGSGAEIVAGGPPWLWGASRSRDGGFQRQRCRSDLLPKDWSRVVGHQRLLPRKK